MTHAILEALADGQSAPPGVQAWARDALRKITSGERVDHALKLDRSQRMRQRNQHLRVAWQLLASEDDSDWQIAGKLAQAIRRHERGMHKRYLLGDDIDPGNELDDELHFAFCCGAGMISSQEKLHKEFKATG